MRETAVREKAFVILSHLGTKVREKPERLPQRQGARGREFVIDAAPAAAYYHIFIYM
jgi:hypothetical protein